MNLEQILIDLGRAADSVVHKGDPRGIPRTTLGPFISTILSCNTLQETLSIGKTVFTRLQGEVFKGLLGKHSGKSCKQALQAYYEVFLCRLCKKRIPQDKCSSETNTCEPCRAEYHRSYSKKHYIENKNTYNTAQAKHYTENKEQYRERNSRRRASKLLRTPKWLTEDDQLAMREFFKTVSVEVHGDHIIPLQGELVSGLHVPENLQYLSAQDNLQKSNKFDPLIEGRNQPIKDPSKC